MSLSSSRHFFEIAGIFCLSFVLFIWGVNTQEVVGFESRFYLFALEMWQNGPSWFPTTYHQPYPDYPATSTLLIYLTAGFLGKMDRLAAVIPTAIAASLTMVITYMLGALHKKLWGLYAVFFLFFTLIFLKSARGITLDIYTTLITTACFYRVYAMDKANSHAREWWIYWLLILGFAFRGPIGLIIPTGVMCTYYLLDRNFKDLFFTSVFALFLLMVCTLLLLTIAHKHGGHEFVHAVLRMEIMGRMAQNHLPYYFYFTTAFKDYAISYIFAFFVAIGVLYYEQRLHHIYPELKLLVKLLGWVMIIMLGMSIPGDKKIRYVLAISPALALMAAYPFVAPKSKLYFTFLAWLGLRFFLILPVLLFIALRVVLRYSIQHNYAFAIPYLGLTQILFTALAFNVVMYLWLTKRQVWRTTGILAVGTLSFVASYILAVEPIQQYLDRAQQFVQRIEAERKREHATLVFYKETVDGLPIKYLINMPMRETPVFINDEMQLMQYDEPAFFVTSEAYYRLLSSTATAHFRTIASDSIGHVPVVVFANN